MNELSDHGAICFVANSTDDVKKHIANLV
jgi:hypothetical protein